MARSQGRQIENAPERPKNRDPHSETYACRYEAVLYACCANGYGDPQEIRRLANIHEKTWRQMRKGEKVRFENYVVLGRVLNRHPLSFVYRSHEAVEKDHRQTCRAFADRIHRLILDGQIPAKIDEEPTDIVSFVWLMGDPEVDAMQITYEQQREAYRHILQDEYQCVVELAPKQIAHLTPMIGRFIIQESPMELMEHDFDMRLHIAESQVKFLRNDRAGKGVEFACVQRDFGECLEEYKSVVADDVANHESIEAVVEADFRCRKAFFRTDAGRQSFEVVYRRSRMVIHLARAFYDVDKFRDWWIAFRDNNSDDLHSFDLALRDANFDQILSIAEKNIESTRHALKQLLHSKETLQSERRRQISVNPNPPHIIIDGNLR